MNPRRHRASAALLLLAAALPVLAGCDGEPDDAAIMSSLAVMHREWADQQRQKHEAVQRPTGPIAGLPRIDLGFEAKLDMRITEVRKIGCRPATGERLGYVCVADVSAAVAGQPPVARRIEGRFIAGWSQWVVRDIRPVEVN